ncbi:hypothetical protein Bind_3537 [Beijerinckia indica subsp. indica ATCC 9039]|uniref:Cytochrome c oxidase subunit IV bacterial aa3 type domain-containing protein n=1 Tax=Beijerinckia indica subsp. indica (strain ATCC 9039 / DSM 1715 / NCIMB 8712) TaxID=395963 RepID=B2IFJ8_BEII9|nr:hypothetical protein Bind_3537 [Beijerinckia indica subsp. indica ATCC 9039]
MSRHRTLFKPTGGPHFAARTLFSRLGPLAFCAKGAFYQTRFLPFQITEHVPPTSIAQFKEQTMSANPAVGGIPAMDYPEHERTYQRFISMVKVTIVGSILLLVVLALVTL